MYLVSHRLCCVAFLNVQYKRTKHLGRDKAPKEPLGVDETCWSEKSVGFTRTSGKMVANRTEKQDGQDAFRYTSVRIVLFQFISLYIAD